LHEAAKLANIEPNVVKMLEQPKRIFQFTIPMKMDNGELKIFTAYRVHYCDALGQTKDGTRFVPDLDLDIVKALGFWMTIKHAVAGGLGVSIVSKIAVEKQMHRDNFLTFSIEEYNSDREFYIVNNKKVALSPRAEAFKQFVISHFHSKGMQTWSS
jgi:DNA-binding transcriptional LysR family regulator